MIILGLSAFYHDSAAAIVVDGKIVAAAQQERFSRKKNDATFPKDAALFCLKEAGVTLDQVDYVAFYDKPLLTFDRLLETYMAYAPSGFTSFVKAIPVWVKEKILQKTLIQDGLNVLGLGDVPPEKILFGFHHHSHAASAYYPSPFDDAAVLVMDGVGEWATTSFGIGEGSKLTLTKEIRFPHSIGMLYSAFTYYLGFKVNDGEYKVMGLAPYGEPRYVDQILDNLIKINDDGSYKLDMQYFNYCTGLTMTNGRFDKLFGGPPRKAQQPLAQKHMDLARSVQVVTEQIVLKLVENLYQETGKKNLCLAGGVALNCVANGRILRESSFENIWIQPAAGDAGSALGVALAVANEMGDGTRYPELPKSQKFPKFCDNMRGSYLGPRYDDKTITDTLNKHGAIFEHITDEHKLFELTADALASENVVGWFQGAMEFGPRSLGNRSILGDPNSSNMQKVLNLKIKYREGFRPFAPAVLQDDASDYFDLDGESPYMLLVAPVLEKHRTKQDTNSQAQGLAKLDEIRSDIPAVTHVDYSARVQTVDGVSNPRFKALLEAFKKKSGLGMLINTSFNVRDEPVVCSPEDAYRCFMATEMDMLVIGDFVLRKHQQ